MSEPNGNGVKLLDSAFVRVMTLLVSLLLIPVIGWLMATMEANSEAIGELKAELPLKTASRYTAEDAKRDQDRSADRFVDDERRIDNLERRQK